MYYEKARRIEDYIIKWRRYFHEHPELTGKEFETLRVIREELDNLGIEHIEVPNGGILGFIKGNKEGDKKVLLRADIDALPVLEKDNNLAGPRVTKSKNEGVMHACGHDGHTAMLLGAAKMLLEEKDNFGGEVILCFERGEEGGGNYRYLHSYMEKFNIVPDTVWGIHLLSTMETGLMAIRDDAMMAGSFRFDVTIEGQGGHGSRPDQAVNPIDAFTAIYNYLQSMRLTKMTPYEALTYSVGTVTAGAVANVIPQTLRFKGTVRFMNRAEVGIPFQKEFTASVARIAEAFGCTATFHITAKPSFPVVNDARAAQFARKVLAKEYGADKVIVPEPWMASESFSAYLNQWPGVFAFLGMKNAEKGVGAAHHNEYFDIDEDVLAQGAAGSVAYAINFLNSDLVFEEKEYKGRFKDYLVESGETPERIAKYYAVEEIK